MANPQTENGYTQLANELLSALCKVRIPGEARQIFDVILRKTYGFNKKKDNISLSQFSEMTGINRQACLRATKKLEEMNLIIVNKESFISEYSIQKDHDKWKLLSKKITVIKKDDKTVIIPVEGVINNDDKTVIKKDEYKRKKETIQKKRKKLFPENSNEFQLSKLLFDFILERNPNHKIPNLQGWAEHIGLMVRVDKRSLREIEGAIRWSQQDSFWQNNILSTAKLRKQFDTIYLKAKGEKDGKSETVITESEFREFAESIANDSRYE